MSTSYIVVAPYVTVRAKDSNGVDVLRGFYAGTPLGDDVDPDDLDRHVRKGMVAKAGTPEALAVSPVGQPVVFDENSNPLTPQQAAEADRRRAAARSERHGRSADRPTDAKSVAGKG